MGQKERNEERLAEMSDEEIITVLRQAIGLAINTVNARRWRSGTGGVLPEGSSGEDIAREAFADVLNGATWAEDKPLWLILKGLIYGKVYNKVHSWENKNFINHNNVLSDDKIADQVAPSYAKTTDDTITHAKSEENDDDLILLLAEAVEDKPEEKSVVDAIINGASKRSEIAQESGLTPGQVTNVRKRLKRIIEELRQKPAVSQH